MPSEWRCGPDCPFYHEIHPSWGSWAKSAEFVCLRLSVAGAKVNRECLWPLKRWEEEADQLAHQLSQLNKAIAARKAQEQPE